MKAPPRLQALIPEGLIDSVVRQLQSGKEADVFVGRCGEDTCAAIEAFLEDKNGCIPFDWTPPRKTTTQKFVCKHWRVSPDGKYQWQILCDFTEVPG